MRAQAATSKSAEKTVKDICRAARRQYSAEEKIRNCSCRAAGRSGGAASLMLCCIIPSSRPTIGYKLKCPLVRSTSCRYARGAGPITRSRRM